MASPRKARLSRYETRERWRTALAHAVVALAGGKARLVVLVLAILFTLWQLYIFAWQPLSADANLPAGLTSVRPQLDVGALAKIRDARAERLQHAPNRFLEADQYFAVPPPAPP